MPTGNQIAPDSATCPSKPGRKNPPKHAQCLSEGYAFYSAVTNIFFGDTFVDRFYSFSSFRRAHPPSWPLFSLLDVRRPPCTPWGCPPTSQLNCCRFWVFAQRLVSQARGLQASPAFPPGTRIGPATLLPLDSGHLHSRFPSQLHYSVHSGPCQHAALPGASWALPAHWARPSLSVLLKPTRFCFTSSPRD